MSFYVTKTNTLKNRHVDLLAYQLNCPFEKENKIYDYLLDDSNKIDEDDFFERQENRLLEIRKISETEEELFSTYEKIISFAMEKGFETIEIAILNEEYQDPSIKFLEGYLLDKDISVGLLLYEFKGKIKCKSIPKYLQKESIQKKKNTRIIAESPTFLCAAPIYLEESFHEKLLRYLSKSSKSNAQIYQDGGLTRQVFSKIISSDLYCPKKNTIICLIIGLELDLDDALTLLESAGYTLSPSILFDSIIKDYLGEGCYNLDEINMTLEENNLPLLGWKPR